MSTSSSAPLPRLNVIIASTRPGRVGPQVAEWFVKIAEEYGRFDVNVVDLAELDLPFMNEPKHPMLRDYAHDHTRQWSETTAAADAVVLVMPEYNHGFTAPLKNAIDYLHKEWYYKPVGFVSYGGIAAGTRAVQMLKPVLTGLRMMPVNAAVNINLQQAFTADGEFAPAGADEAALAVLTELSRLADALQPLRREAVAA
jgi:NAD(P)H-dependent FMN reductase